MGVIHHNAIIVTSWNSDHVKAAHEKARMLFSFPEYELSQNLVSEIVPGLMNLTTSFFVAPDGSKEGWLTSDEVDDARREFLDWLRSQTMEHGLGNGPLYLDWAHVSFGELQDELETPYPEAY